MVKPDLCKEDEEGRRLGRTGSRSYAILMLSIGVRAVHQVGAAVFLVWYLLGLGERVPAVYMTMALLSGAILVVTEWLRHRQLYRELSGIVTMGKCILLGAAMHGFLPETPFVLLVFLIASLGAHAPKNVRHRLLF